MVEKTRVGRDINRHNYTLQEVETEVNRPVIKKLFALCKHRNTYKAFDGDFSLKTYDRHNPWLLEMKWELGAFLTRLTCDFKQKIFHIFKYDTVKSKELQFNLETLQFGEKTLST